MAARDPALIGADSIEVLSPPEQQAPDLPIVFPSVGDIVFAWRATPSATIAVALDAFPSGTDVLMTHTIWGFVLGPQPPGSTNSSAQWADGYSVRGGVWSKPAQDPPTDRSLYLFVEELEDATLVATNDPGPFRLHSGWPTVGTSCADDTQCEVSTRLQRCLSGACAVLCLSDGDCPSGMRCAPPSGGVKTCTP
jgi:hypothetical protein